LWWNRTLDNKVSKDQINEIVEHLEETPVLYGMIEIICDNKTNKAVIANGHHRLKALREILNKHPNYDISAWCRIHYVDSLTDESTITMINKMNKNVPYVPKDNPSTVIIETVDKMCRIYDKFIKDGKCYRPNVSKSTLKSIIEKAIEESKIADITSSQLVTLLGFVNKELESLGKKVKKLITKEIKEVTLRKAFEHSFFLGTVDEKHVIDRLVAAISKM
jgi:hypothetical protein